LRRTAAALLAVLTFGCPSRSEPPKPRPAPVAAAAGNGINVLLITIDTLRADHLGTYGYRRATSPHIDALATEGAVFDQAYTFWPKTRGSFVMMMTGRRPSQNGYDKAHQMVLDFNPTLAAALQAAGYATSAFVDNPNLAAQHGYAKGFERYRETMSEAALATEMDRTRAITEDARRLLARPGERPFFLWLHYVNPHAPYEPPAPFDTAFLDAEAEQGPVLAPVEGFHGGVPKAWAVKGRRLGYYVARYDGEIATVDAEVGKVLDALRDSPVSARTMVVVTSDHGESLGEHDYYFDHGENLFDPCLRIPLIVRLPGATAGVRTSALASTLDLLPTILDAVKVSYPSDIAGRSLLPEVLRTSSKAPERLFAQNERNLSATFDARLKTVAAPLEKEGWRFTLYDREADPGEHRDASAARADVLRVHRRELELFFDRAGREWSATRTLVGGQKPAAIPCDQCERLRALGYTGVAGCEACHSGQ
jgi:arylsulfatase A-like enzyme